MTPRRGLLLCFFVIVAIFSAAPLVDSAKKVSLALYYETLCPYCSRFMVNYLPKIFKDGLISIVDLELVPHGNARVDPNGTITCQHGAYECLLNTVEACVIKTWPAVNQHYKFIYCIEQLVVEGKYLQWESCFQKTDSNAVRSCFNSGHGKQLELQYAAKTAALKPPHTYVPWVVVDGQPLYDDYENFESYVCKAYKGNLPKACKGSTLMVSPKLTANQGGRVCYANRIINRSAPGKQQARKIEMLL